MSSAFVTRSSSEVRRPTCTDELNVLRWTGETWPNDGDWVSEGFTGRSNPYPRPSSGTHS
jgi:hypothetical protein